MSLALLVAACGPSPSATTSGAPSASPSAAPEPTEAAPAPWSPTACSAPPTVCRGPLPAGDYVSDTTGAHVAFTLDGHDWAGIADTAGAGFGLLLADVPGAYMRVLAFTGQIHPDACDPDAASEIAATPEAFMSFLDTATGIASTIQPPAVVEVGGRPGLQVDLVTDVDDACATSGGGTLWLWQLPGLGSFQFNDGQSARVVAVDAETATVIVMAEALPEGQAEYDHFLEHFGELLNAMTIGPLDLSYWARSARRRSTNRSMRSIASSICS